MLNKKCNKCEEIKEVTKFYRDKSISDGYATICKSCKNISMSKWREENREKYNANMRYARATQHDTFKNIDLKRTYGITLEDFNRMLKEQNNLCAICDKGPQGKRPLVVDHNHATDRVRQLLCYGCNRALHVLENKELYEKAMKYLKKHDS